MDSFKVAIRDDFRVEIVFLDTQIVPLPMLLVR